MHTGLAEMYVADPRFTATYEKIAPGLAQYLHDAIQANAAPHTALMSPRSAGVRPWRIGLRTRSEAGVDLARRRRRRSSAP